MSSVKRGHLLDVALIALLASAAAVGVAGYRRFQVPVPEISSVSPARVVAGAARPLSVRGRYLHPYLHTFVFASGHTPAMNAIDPAKQEAKAVTTTATQLDVTLPLVTPGVYDVYLFNEFQQVAFVPRAFTVETPEYGRGEMIATLRFFLDPVSAGLLASGDRDRSAPADPDAPKTEGAVVTAVRMDRAEHQMLEMRIGSAAPGDGVVWLGSRSALRQVDLDLRVPLVKEALDEWRYKGTAVRAGQFMDVETSRFKGRGLVIAVSDPRPANVQASRR